MITVTLYCKYPRRDGTTQNAVVKKHCLRETQIASTKKKVLKRFEKTYVKTGACGTESYMVMVVFDNHKDTYYDTDSGWCYIGTDRKVLYDFY